MAVLPIKYIYVHAGVIVIISVCFSTQTHSVQPPVYRETLDMSERWSGGTMLVLSRRAEQSPGVIQRIVVANASSPCPSAPFRLLGRLRHGPWANRDYLWLLSRFLRRFCTACLWHSLETHTVLVGAPSSLRPIAVRTGLCAQC